MRDKQYHVAGFIMIVIVILLFVFSSCDPAKKATTYMQTHKDKLAELCAENFPVKDSIIVRDSVSFDTIYNTDIFFDTTVVKDTVRITKYLPGKTVIKTVRKDSIIVRRDMANESHLINQLSASVKESGKLKLERDNLQAFKDSMKGKVHIPWWILALAGVALTGWAYWRIKAGALNKVIHKLK